MDADDFGFMGEMRTAAERAVDDLRDHAYRLIKAEIIAACDRSKLDFYSLHGTRFVKRGGGLHGYVEVDDYPEIIEAVFWHDGLFGFPDCYYENGQWYPEGEDDSAKEARAKLRRGEVGVIGKVIGLGMPMRPKRKGDHGYPPASFKDVREWVVARTMSEKQEARFQNLLENRLAEIDCDLQTFDQATGARAHYHLEIIGSAPDAVITALVEKAAADVGYYRDPKPKAET